MEVCFEDICKNVSKRVDNPNKSGLEKFVGLDHLDSEQPKVTRFGSTEKLRSSMGIFKPGQILFGRRNWYLRKIAIPDFKGICSADIYVLEPTGEYIVNNFLRLFLQSEMFYQKGMMLSEGTMSTRIKWKELAKQKFLIPPISTQNKIIEIFSILDNAIEDTEQLIEKSMIFRDSLLSYLMTNGSNDISKHDKNTNNDIQMSWEMTDLKNIVSEFVNGGTPLTTNTEFWGGSIPWMRSASIDSRYIDNGEKMITQIGLDQSSTNLVPKGNLIIATRVSLGNFGITRTDIAISQDLTGLIIDKNKADEEFVYWAFVYYNKKLKSLEQGTTVKGILREDLEHFSIPLPSLEEQKTIKLILNESDDSYRDLFLHLTKLKKLRKAFLAKLLSPKNNLLEV